VSGPLNQLVNKLVLPSIIEKRSGLLHFTPAFCRHVLKCQSKRKSNSVETWREIIDSYCGKPLDLTDKEITEVIVFLDYYLDKKSSDSDDEIEV
jgi:hypothetical protein